MDDLAPVWRASLVAARDTFASIEPSALDAPVAWCPGWTVRDVLAHVGGLHRWVTGLLAAPLDQKVSRKVGLPAPVGADIVTWVVDGIEEMAAALEATESSALVNTWAGPQEARWWARRQAHENAVHAWDAAAAAGGDHVIDPALAVDGLDEVFDLFVPMIFRAETFAAKGETLHLHATDASGEWLLRFADAGVEVERTHAKGDGAARGQAADLLLAVWNRPVLDRIERLGDAELLPRFARAIAV